MSNPSRGCPGERTCCTRFFFLAALLWYRRYQESTAALPYAVTFVLFHPFPALQLAAVTFPALCLLLDFFAKRPFSPRIILEKIPFFAASVAFGVLAIMGQRREGTVDAGYTLSFVNRLLIAAYSYMFYVTRFFVPVKLSAFYPYPASLPASLPLSYTLSPLFILLSAGTVWYCRRSRVFLFGYLFFLLSIVFLLHFIPVGATVTADRFTYLPFIGSAFIVAHCFRKGLSGGQRAIMPRAAFAVLCLGMVAALSYAAFNRCKVWRNSETLWTDVIDSHANVPMAFNNLGTFYSDTSLALYEAGDPEGGIFFLEKAIREFDAVIDADSVPPGNSYATVCRALAYSNRGSAWSLESVNSPAGSGPDSGLLIRALSDYSRSIALNPAYAPAYHNRANAFAKLGFFDSAFADYARSTALDSLNPTVYYDRGLNDNLVNRFDDAIKDFSRALSIDPRFAKAYNDRGIAFAQKGAYITAHNDFKAALSINPNDHNTLENLNRVMAILHGESRPVKQ